MNIKLYHTNSPRNKLNKSISLVANIDGESNIGINENPMRVVLSKGHLQGVQGSNYLYCTDTDKYYYIENYEVQNQTVILTCKVDVLMSFKSQILANTCTISKNENVSNGYLYDDGYQLLSYRNIVTKEFPNGFDTNSIILMTVG